jgi:hypothetical protein
VNTSGVLELIVKGADVNVQEVIYPHAGLVVVSERRIGGLVAELEIKTRRFCSQHLSIVDDMDEKGSGILMCFNSHRGFINYLLLPFYFLSRVISLRSR